MGEPAIFIQSGNSDVESHTTRNENPKIGSTEHKKMDRKEATLETEGQSKIEGISSWEDTCRVCANVREQMIPIFENEGAEHKLSDKIHTYLPIKVSQEDSLPLKLCYNCVTTLLAWHELVSGCLPAEKRLLRMQDEIKRKKSKQVEDPKIPSSSGLTVPLSINERREKEALILLIKYIEKTTSQELVPENIAVSELVDDPEPLATDTSSTHQNEKESSVIDQQEKQTSEIVEQCITGKKMTERFGIMKKPNKQFIGKHRISLLRSEKKIKVADNKLGLKNGEDKTSKSPLDSTGENRPSRSAPAVDVDKRIEETLGKADKQDLPIIEEPKTESFAVERRDVTVKSEKSQERNDPTTNNESNSEENGAPKKVKCAICLRKYADAKNLYFHAKVHENLPESFKIFQCIECDKTFRLKDSFVRHLRIHRDERPFTCHVCGKQFRDSGGLSRHIKDVHAKLKNFSCDLCGNSFSSKATRDDHRRTHTGERPYVCSTCNKSFKSKACLYSHNKLHTNEFPHSCAYCTAKFRRRQEMLIHATTHTGEKNYSCDVCFVRFRVKTEVARHKLTHSDEKPFVCAKCGLRFRQKRYLTNHIKSRHSQSWKD